MHQSQNADADETRKQEVVRHRGDEVAVLRQLNSQRSCGYTRVLHLTDGFVARLPRPNVSGSQLMIDRERLVLDLVRHRNVLASAGEVVDQNGCRGYSWPFLVSDMSWRDESSNGLTIGIWLEIGAQICDGLSAFHRAGLVHWDVKPDNILFASPDPDGRPHPVLIDVELATPFGLRYAKLRGDGSEETAGIVGTSATMSPAQARGDPASVEHDLFSMAMLMASIAIKCIGRHRIGTGFITDWEVARVERSYPFASQLEDRLSVAPGLARRLNEQMTAQENGHGSGFTSAEKMRDWLIEQMQTLPSEALDVQLP